MPHGRCYRLATSSLDRAMVRRSTDLIGESLDGLLPPSSYSPLQGTQLSLAVPVWITHLELDEQLERGLIRTVLETLDHLRPMARKDVTLPTAPFVIEHPVGLGADGNAARACVFTPAVHSSKERRILPWCEPARELDAQLVE